MLHIVTSAPAAYPSELETEVATRDGSLVHIRPVRPDDADRLLAFLQALPREDRYMRFFSLGGDPEVAGARLQPGDCQRFRRGGRGRSHASR
jgi:hypothetical protein